MVATLTVNDVYVSEGDGAATVTFRLSEPATTAASVDFFTSDGLATRFSDYVSVGTTTINFAVGEQEKTFDVNLTDSATIEPIEAFYINLRNPVDLTLEESYALVTIFDDDNGSRPPYVSVEDVWVDETDGFAHFNIILDRATSVPLSVNYATQGATATPGDYTNTSGTAVFDPGELVKTISVPIIDDSIDERSEFFRFNLTGVSGVTGAQIADGQALAFISKSDGAPLFTPSVSIVDQTLNEGIADGTIDITLKLNAPSSTETSVEVFTSDARATRFSDYVSTGTVTVVFQPGETVRTISTPIRNDGVIEAVEELYINIRNPVGLNINDPFQTFSIVDNDDGTRPPIVSVENKDVDEKDEFAVFVIHLDRVATVPVTVNYQTVAGSASAGVDYRTTTGSVTINPGETSAEVAVEITDDGLAETIETFQFNLTSVSGVTGAAIGDGEAVGTIGTSDTTTAGTPAVTIDHMTFSEGETDRQMEIVLRLDAPSANATTVNVFTSDGTGTRFSDYISTNKTVRFEPGETVKVVEFPVRNDLVIEQPESFYVSLSSPVGLIIPQSYKTYAIYDNDAGDRAPILYAFDRRVDEKDEFVHFDIVMDRASPVSVTVSFETQNGSAVAGSDFVGESGSVTFNPFETVKTISIPLIDDISAEAAQTFFLNLTDVSGFTGASIAKPTAQATIGISDTTPLGTPTVSIGEQTIVEGEFERLVEVPILLNAPSTIPTSVSVFTADGTASRFSDYVSFNTTINFLPGETVKTIRFPLRNDLVAEGTKEFTVNLSSATGLIISDPSTVFTILDDGASQASISVRDVQKDEGDVGATLFEFVVTRSGDTSLAQTVDWAAEGFSAGSTSANGVDFVGGAFPTGTVNFSVGDSQKTFTVSVQGDGSVEVDETFAVRLSNPSAGLVIIHEIANATILNDDVVSGATVGNDNLTGTLGNDEIDLLAGDDVYTALGGSDEVQGGAGNDTIRGDSGNDTLLGGSGFDQITGGNGNDIIDGGTASDLLFGNGGADSLVGGTGADSVFGGAGNDTIQAGGSNDDVLGQGGADLIHGDNGSDTLRGGSGNDTIDGGANNDQIFGNGNNDLLIGGSGNDTMQGAGGLDTLEGGSGDDVLTGGVGVDSLDGGTGDDVLNGGANADRFVFANGYDEDRINSYQQGSDRIELDDALWAGTPGISDGQDVVDTFGASNGTGSILTLDFGGGDVLEIQSAGGINAATLGDDILIF